jgi:hypothetical protein
VPSTTTFAAKTRQQAKSHNRHDAKQKEKKKNPPVAIRKNIKEKSVHRPINREKDIKHDFKNGSSWKKKK